MYLVDTAIMTCELNRLSLLHLLQLILYRSYATYIHVHLFLISLLEACEETGKRTYSDTMFYVQRFLVVASGIDADIREKQHDLNLATFKRAYTVIFFAFSPTLRPRYIYTLYSISLLHTIPCLRITATRLQST